MGISRRNALIGLGSLVVGGGAVIGTGAFTSVTAQRTVNVETAGDGSAFLGLQPTDDSNDGYAQESGGLLQINLDGSNTDGNGLNQNAVTRIDDIVEIANNGNQPVTDLTFQFNVDGADQNDNDVEDAFSITATDLEDDEAVTIPADGNTNILDEDVAPDGANGHDSLDQGEAFTWGISIDLLNSQVNDISGDPDITLTITADA